MPVEQHVISELRTCLTRTPQQIPARWLYDSVGSRLFEEITGLDEYYPTRTERAILSANADRIAQFTRAQTIIEIGAGSAAKVGLLIRPLQEKGAAELFVAQDISSSYLDHAARSLRETFPRLATETIQADFSRNLRLDFGRSPRLVLFLGGTIGNLEPEARQRFLSSVFSAIDEGDSLLIGADLVKIPERLLAAYDDASGVTEKFIRNIVTVAKREWGATFRPDAFDYRAQWNSEENRIDMSLVAREQIRVDIPWVNLTFELSPGEALLVEKSHKFTLSSLESELENAQFAIAEIFTDDAKDFAVALATKQKLARVSE